MKKIVLLIVLLVSEGISHIQGGHNDRSHRKKQHHLVSRINNSKRRGKKNVLLEKQPTETTSLSVRHRPLIVPGSGKTLELRGSIRVHNKYDAIPQFRVLFDGRETMSNSEGFFSIPTDLTSLDEYSLVMTKKIIKEFDKNNTLKCLKVIPDMPYQYFRFTRNIASGEWEMTEKRLFSEDFIIPEHAVVVLLNPQKYVEFIEPWDITLPDGVLKMPQITLKGNLPLEQMSRHSAKSLLYSLDEGKFHEQITHTHQPKQADAKVKISRVG